MDRYRDTISFGAPRKHMPTDLSKREPTFDARAQVPTFVENVEG
jgi:hypothetical protein